MSKILRRFLWCFSILIVLAVLFMWYANIAVLKAAEGKCYSDISYLPEADAVVLLGTSPKLKNGNANPYFTYRIEAAIKLYKSGKVKKIIVSGDNHKKGYDEPSEMEAALRAAGVPDSIVMCDYAGFRTLDSVLRSRDVFGVNSVIFISQQFHNERALYLAENYNIPAWGYNAQDVGKSFGFRTRLREYAARAKAVLDVWFGVKPRFER